MEKIWVIMVMPVISLLVLLWANSSSDRSPRSGEEAASAPVVLSDLSPVTVPQPSAETPSPILEENPSEVLSVATAQVEPLQASLER